MKKKTEQEKFERSETIIMTCDEILKWIYRICIFIFLVISIILIFMGQPLAVLASILFGVGVSAIFSRGITLEDYAFLIWWNGGNKD